VIDRPAGLGPVQLVIIAFDGGTFEGKILAELRRLGEQDAVRLLDLLFVAKGGGSANKAYLFRSTPAVLIEMDVANFVAARRVL